MYGDTYYGDPAIAETLGGRSVRAAVGAFSLSGKAAGLRATRLIALGAGTFALTGVAAGLTRAQAVAAETGEFVLTGVATIETDPTLAAEAGSFAVTGNDAGLVRDWVRAAARGQFLLSGAEVNFLRTRVLRAERGAFLLAGRPADLVIGTEKLDIIEAMDVEESIFSLEYGQDVPQHGSGSVRTIDQRPPLWRARLMSPVMDHDDAAGIDALINIRDGAAGTFYCWNPKKQYPAADPDGSILGASTVTIQSVDSSQNLTLEGLPSGYVLTRGDFLHFDFGSPRTRGFHRIVKTATASAAGEVSIRVRPHLLPGATAGLGVTLIQPAAEMSIVPGSHQPSQYSTIYDRVEFEALQVIP